MQKVEVLLIDDLTGTEPADESVEFSLDGQHYEIDLSSAHAKKLRTQLSPFVGAARIVKRGRPSITRPQRVKPKVDKEQLDAIRLWANDHGYEVSARGRIPATVQEAYHQAHQPEPVATPKARRSRAKAVETAGE